MLFTIIHLRTAAFPESQARCPPWCSRHPRQDNATVGEDGNRARAVAHLSTCLHRKRAQYRKQMPGCPILIPAPARVPRVRPGLSLVFMLGGVHFSIGVPADPSILILFSVSHAVSQRPRKCKQHKHEHGQIEQRKVQEYQLPEIHCWKPCTIKCKVMSNRVFRPEGP